jgi:hypothetical protein
VAAQQLGFAAAVPEPATAWMLGCGALALGAAARRRQARR